MIRSALLISLLFSSTQAMAKIDLVTLPNRDSVQVTIYNSADLTLVREHRALTLRKGANRLQFSWENTLIDPTSLSLSPLAQADKVDVTALVYPPRIKNLGLWTVNSEMSGQNPMEITYLTSGLSWRAFYMGTLTADESKLRLQGYVRVSNNSGEDYDNAQTRLIVGKVHLIDKIAALAKRGEPFGRPGLDELNVTLGKSRQYTYWFGDTSGKLGGRRSTTKTSALKRVEKEGLSEYFLYTIEGKESIPHGWAKRLPSFHAAEVPVINLYKYDEGQYGHTTVRFLSFNNDKKHTLGETPIPGGLMKVFRQADADRHLAYEGQSNFKYIPIDEKVELNLGAVGNVAVHPILMDYKTQAFLFDAKGNINGWDEERTWKLALCNTRDVGVKIQIDRHFTTSHWAAKSTGADHEKMDLDTIRYSVELPPRTKKEITYVLTTRHGERENQ